MMLLDSQRFGGYLTFQHSNATATPEVYGLASSVMSPNGMENPGSLCSYSGGYLVVPATAFALTTWWYHASNTAGFAYPTAGSFSLTFQYPGTFVGGAMLLELAGKARLGPPDAGADTTYDTNDGISLVTALYGGTLPGLGFGYAGNNGAFTTGTPTLKIESAAINTDYTIRAWWNASATRKLILQVNNDPPVVDTTTLTAWLAPIAHELIEGNDTTNAMAYKYKDLVINQTAPVAYQMTCAFWQDFGFTTVNGTNLAAWDHSAIFSWLVSGTVATLSTNADAYIALPRAVNNQTSTSGKGLKIDLNTTSTEYVKCTVSAATNAVVVGFALKNIPSLASGNTQVLLFTDDNAGDTRSITKINLKNNAGSYELNFTDYNGGTAIVGNSAALVLGSAVGKDVWVTAYIIRGGGTCKLRAYDFTGGVLGSMYDAERTVIGGARNLTNIAIGTNVARTAEAAGTYLRVSHFCFEGPGQTTGGPIFPMLPDGT